MTRNELVEMIRQEIRSLAYETLRNKSSNNKKDDKRKAFKPKGLSEEEIEKSLFYGGEEPEEDDAYTIIKTTIKESYDGIPKINSSEITEFEDSFEEMLKEIDGASVIFDTQSNGYSMKAWFDKEGIQAGASGVINLGREGKINWTFSLKDGLTVTTDDLFLDKGNKKVFEKLYNHYDSWQKDWREKLTIQPSEKQNMPSPEETPEPSSEEDLAPEPSAETGAPTSDAGDIPTA